MAERTAAGGDQHSEAPARGNEQHVAGNENVRWGVNLITFVGVFTVANGILFLYRTYFTDGFETGIDTLGGITRPELGAMHPEVLSYILHLHVNLAATFLALGIGIVSLAWFGVRRGQGWPLATAVALPAVFLSLSIPAHQTVTFEFDAVLHMGPAAIGAPILLVGAVLAYLRLRATKSTTLEGRDR